MADETLDRVIKQVAEKYKVKEELVRSLWNFQNKKTNELVNNLGRKTILPNSKEQQILEIKIPYIGTIRFNSKYYEKNYERYLKASADKKMQSENQS